MNAIFPFLRQIIAPCLLLLLCSSCFQDRWAEYADQTALDQWIEKTMQAHYLWSDHMSKGERNYFIEPDKFLESLISRRHDKGYSHIDSLQPTPELSYGFHYALYRNEESDTLVNLLVQYVERDSPASRAGLQRGDWVIRVNDTTLTRKNEKQLLQSGRALTLQLGTLTQRTEANGRLTNIIVDKHQSLSLSATAPVEEHPIVHHSILDTPKGIRVGYIVYNRFTAGTAAEPERYHDELRAISREFASRHIDALILDLRYNTGGDFSASHLLASLLAPADALGTPFAHLMGSDTATEPDTTWHYSPQLIGSGSNLNLQAGLLLTSSQTTGIAGTFYHCLAPLGRWGIIGSNLQCQGITTSPFRSPDSQWLLSPVVAYVNNSHHEGAFESAYQIPAELQLSETSDLSHFLPFGHPDEALLNHALRLLDGDIPLQPASVKNEQQ